MRKKRLTFLMTLNRISLHLGFWLLYISIIFFNEVFLTSDYSSKLNEGDVLKIFLSNFFVQVIFKLIITYLTLYFFLPLWLKNKKRLQVAILFAIFFLLFVLAYRVAVFYISFPLIKQQMPLMTPESLVARYLYSLLDILQIVSTAIAIKLLRTKLRLGAVEREYLIEKSKSEILRLKAQINPHFLFNMLNTLYSFSQRSTEKMSEVLLKLSDLLRFMLYESSKKVTTISSELKVVDSYLSLQQARYNNVIKITKSYDIDDMNIGITPLLIFPLVENSFKHGILREIEKTEINIGVKVKKGRFELKITNTIPEKVSKTETEDGIGLDNVKRQLSLLYKSYDFNTNIEEQIFTVNLVINLNSYVDFEMLNN